MQMLMSFPSYPSGTQLTFLLVELLQAEQQLVDSGYPDRVVQFMAATAGLRASLVTHIRNHPAMAPAGGGEDLFHLPPPAVVLHRGGSSSNRGGSSSNRGRCRLDADERKRRMDKELCLACGEPGHWKHECPNMGKGKGRGPKPPG